MTNDRPFPYRYYMPVNKCHEFGGKTATGKPCNKTVTDGRPCPQHRPEADAILQDKKKKFLEVLESGDVCLTNASESIDTDPATVWRWRKNDPEFDKAVRAAAEQSDKVRTYLVEDALYKAALAGNVTAQQVWLYNRAPDRWRDKRNITHSDPEGKPLKFTLNIENGNGNGDGHA